MPVLLLKQFRFYIPKSFKLEGIARRIREEERSLLTGESFKADVGLDNVFRDHPFQPLGELLPVVELHDHPTVGDGNAMVVDWVIECRNFAIRSELRI